MSIENSFDDIMRTARQMQKSMEVAQKQLDFIEEIGEAGDGAVKIATNGHYTPLRVSLDDSLQGKDMRSLEALILAALQDVVQKVNKASQDALMGVTKDIPLPASTSLLEEKKEEERA
jgi:DNA-binding YbaB/EbfC family protein